MKFPRPRTKVRAVFDLLSDGKIHTYGECCAEYSAAGEWKTNSEYIGMEMTRILKKYANRIVRGQWQMKPEYCQAVLDEKVIARADHLKGPFTRPTAPADPKPAIFSGSFVVQGDPTIADMAWGSTRYAATPAGSLTEPKHDCSGCHRDCVSAEMNQEIVALLEEAKSQCSVLQKQIDNRGEVIRNYEDDLQARETVIKNQLEWINRLEVALGTANSKLAQIMAIVEEA